MKILPFKFWMHFLFPIFILFSTTGLTLLLSNGGSFSEGSIIQENKYNTYFNYLFFILGSLTIFYFCIKSNFKLFLSNNILVFIFGFIFIFLHYLLFNSDLNLSLVLNYILFISLIYIFYFRYGFLKLFRLFYFSLYYILLISLFFIIFLPSYGVSEGLHDGSWQGIYTHKNQFGIFLFIFLTLTLFNVKLKAYNGFFNYLNILIIFFCIYMTGSSTSLVVSILSLFLFFMDLVLPGIMKKISTYFIFKIFIVITMIVLVINSSYFMTTIFGKAEGGYSNRDLLWLSGLNAFKNNNIFFGITSNNIHISDYIFQNVGFEVQNFHNSYIEVLVYYGILGFIFIFMPLILVLKKSKNKDFFITYSILFPLMIYMFMESFYLGKSLVIFYLLLMYFYLIDLRIKK